MTPPPIEGRIELIDDGVVHGWAWCPSNSTERIELDVLLDGQVVGATVADLVRPTLAAAGYRGAHGFRMSLPATDDPAAPHLICVRRGTSRLPPATAFTVRADAHGRWDGARFQVDSGELSAWQPPLEGRIELIGDGRVEGWAWVPTMPTAQVLLTLQIDDKEVARTVAELPRPSLGAAGIGDGAHAFHFVLPEECAHPGERRVRVGSCGELLPPASRLKILSVARSDDPWYGARFVLDRTTASRPTDRASPLSEQGLAPVPAPPPVLGSGGWLFDGALVRPHADATRIADVVSQAAAILKRLELLAERLGEVGVKLLPVLMPAKEHVYAEYLPIWGEASVAIRPGDLIQGGLFVHPTLEALDLMPVLRAGAEAWPVYSPLRPSRTDWGTYCTYRAMIKRLAALIPGVPAPLELPADAVTVAPKPRAQRPALVSREGRLVVEAISQSIAAPDEPVIAIPPRGAELTSPEHLARLNSRLAIGWEQAKRRDLPRVLVVGHSRDSGLVEWLARNLRFAVLIGTDTPLVDLVALERPDAIFYLIDEADLMLPLHSEAEANAIDPALDVARGSEVKVTRTSQREPRVGQEPTRSKSTIDPSPGGCGFCGSRERAEFGGRSGALCLGCGSLERHRALLMTMGAEALDGAGRKAVEIAPLNEVVYGSTLRGWGWQYTGIDQSRTGSPYDSRQIGFIDYEADVRNLDRLADHSVDLIILQCVLEEVPDVDAALAELARVLAPTGQALLEIPFNPRLPASITQPPDHFGDVWKFGADLPDRVRRQFATVDVIAQREGEYAGRVCLCRGTP